MKENENNKLRWTPTHPKARLHEPEMDGDLGFDMVCCEDALLEPGKMAKISLGMKVALPAGYGCTFMARSSYARMGLLVLPGLIDNGYRGPLYLFCVNFGAEAISIREGDRVAQLVLMHQTKDAIEVERRESLDKTARGENGFGHTTRKVDSLGDLY